MHGGADCSHPGKQQKLTAKLACRSRRSGVSHEQGCLLTLAESTAKICPANKGCTPQKNDIAIGTQWHDQALGTKLGECIQ